MSTAYDDEFAFQGDLEKVDIWLVAPGQTDAEAEARAAMSRQ